MIDIGIDIPGITPDEDTNITDDDQILPDRDKDKEPTTIVDESGWAYWLLIPVLLFIIYALVDKMRKKK